MAVETILQRIRFCGLQPVPAASNPFFGEKFNLERWLGQGRSAYWSIESRGQKREHTPAEIIAGRGVILSADTFFNAFFIAYWRKLTALSSLSLRLRFAGKFLLQVLRHTESGETEILTSAKIGLQGETEYHFQIGTTPEQLRGLRFSFTLVALQDEARVLGGEWVTTDPPPRPTRLAIVLATYNRHSFVGPLIERILADPALAAEAITLHVIDHSDEALLDHFNGPRCHVGRHRNMGTGGFVRGMCELAYAEEAQRPTHILLIDDDIALDTDAILRAFRMVQFARTSFMLGGAMLDFHAPNIAYCMGEFYEQTRGGYYFHRQHLPQSNLALPSTLNAVSVPNVFDYSAWWFCLMPVEAILKTQLPIPFFLRGDDIEYGVRLKKNQCIPHTVPGIGVWHVPFGGRTFPWLTYLEKYNFLVANCLHGFDACAAQFRQHGEHVRAYLLRGKLDYAEAHLRVLEDFMKGWPYFKGRTFPAYLQQIRAEMPGGKEEEAAPQEEQVMALLNRLLAVLTRFPEEGERIQQEFAAQLPRTYTMNAWKGYLREGNLSAL